MKVNVNIDNASKPTFSDMERNSWAINLINKDFLIYKSKNGNGYWLDITSGSFFPVQPYITLNTLLVEPIRSGSITIEIG